MSAGMIIIDPASFDISGFVRLAVLLLEIAGTGHVVQHNRATEVAEAITAFAGLRTAATDTQQANPA